MSIAFTLSKNISFNQVELSSTSRSFVDAEDISAAFLATLTEKGISKQDVFFTWHDLMGV